MNNAKNVRRLTSPYSNSFRPQWQTVNQQQQQQNRQPILNLNNQQQAYFNNNRFPGYQNIPSNEVNEGNSYESAGNIRNGNGLNYKIVHLKLKMEPQNGSNIENI